MRGAIAFACVLVVAGCAGNSTAGGGSPPAITSSSPTPAVTAASPSPSPTALPTAPATVLVFQSGAPPNFHFSLAGPDGTVFKTVDVTGASASTWQGDSAALFLMDSTNKKYFVLRSDGSIAPIPDSLSSNFDGTPTAFGQEAGDPIFLNNHTVVGIQGYGNAKYVLLDLNTQQKTTLLTVTPTINRGIIQPPSILQLGLSSDRKVARVLIQHAVVNGTNVPQWAVAEIDMETMAVTSIRQLPIQAKVDPFDAFEPAISADGRLLAYQENVNANAQNVAIYTTHVVDLTSGQNIALIDRSIQCTGNSRGLRFSPDGTSLMAYGSLAPEFGSGESLMALFDTSDGHLLWRQNVGSTLANQITPVGWIGGHTLVYEAATTAVPGNFTAGNFTAHSVDALTGKSIDLTIGGQLVAVLR
jgi:hypothetical protein